LLYLLLGETVVLEIHEALAPERIVDGLCSSDLTMWRVWAGVGAKVDNWDVGHCTVSNVLVFNTLWLIMLLFVSVEAETCHVVLGKAITICSPAGASVHGDPMVGLRSSTPRIASTGRLCDLLDAKE
jgi:hypothetical protein